MDDLVLFRLQSGHKLGLCFQRLEVWQERKLGNCVVDVVWNIEVNFDHRTKGSIRRHAENRVLSVQIRAGPRVIANRQALLHGPALKVDHVELYDRTG